jgi:nicotinate-nucleotide--dimethylbenzimidazole phosphoribosyltransferase
MIMSKPTLLTTISPLDEVAMTAARARQNMLTKPAGSLGRLESLSIQLAGITAQARPKLREKVVVIMAGDHGVATAGVSAYPSEVTMQMVGNFLRGGAAINVLARVAGARIVVVDMGVAAELPPHPHLIVHKIASGTANIVQEPAMRREDAVRTLQAGAQVVQDEAGRGLDVLALGDMGIGNTTPSAAIACAILGVEPAAIVGRGTGVDDDGLTRKQKAVAQALHRRQPDPTDALDVLAKVGGFEIGGLAGAMIAAAAHRIPVVIDGFITTAAALIAAQLMPAVKPYLIAAHCSQETGHAAMLTWLGLTPLFDFGLRLGEGSGAALALPVIDAAARILDEMTTFGEAGVSEKEAPRII